MQIGLPPGNYTVTVEKDGMKQTSNVRVSLDIAETTITLKPGGSGAPMTKEEAAKAQAKMEGLKTAFSEGAALSNAGKYDEAIAKFNQVLADVPKCTECYINIGATYGLKKDYANAETAFKKALELDPNSVEAYYGLASIYNDQQKFTEAQAMSAEASKRAGSRCGRRRGRRAGQRRHALQPGGHRLERQGLSRRRRSSSPRLRRRIPTTPKRTTCSAWPT